MHCEPAAPRAYLSLCRLNRELHLIFRFVRGLVQRCAPSFHFREVLW